MASRPGPKLKLTNKIIEEFDAVLAMGAYFKDACAHVGVSQRQAYFWLQLADEEARRLEAPEEERSEPNPSFVPIMGKFADMVAHRSAKVKNMVLGSIVLAAQKDWRAGAWFLEHRYPKEFGATLRAEVSGEGSGVSTVIIGIVDQIKRIAQGAEPSRPGDGQVIQALPATIEKAPIDTKSESELFDM